MRNLSRVIAAALVVSGCSAGGEPTEAPIARATSSALTVSAETAIETPGFTAAPVIANGAASVGSTFLVLYDKTRAARITAAGVNLDPAGLAVGGAVAPTAVAVASDGTRFVVVRVEGGAMFARTVGTDGTVSADISLGACQASGGFTYSLSLAQSGGVFLAACAPNLGAIVFDLAVTIVRFRADGTILEAPRMYWGACYPTVAGGTVAGGSTFLVGYNKTEQPTPGAILPGEVRAFEVPSSGSIGFPGVTVATGGSMAAEWSPTAGKYLAILGSSTSVLLTTGGALASTKKSFPWYARPFWDGTRWVVSNGTTVLHVDTAGNQVETTPVALPGTFGSLAAVDSANLLFLDARWAQFLRPSDLGPNARTWILRTDGAAGAPTLAVDSTGTTLATWLDDREPVGVYGVRVSNAGAPIDLAAKYFGATTTHASTWGAGTWFVATKGRLGKMSSTGTVTSVATAFGGDPSRALFDGSNAFVTGSGAFARIASDGTVAGSGAVAAEDIARTSLGDIAAVRSAANDIAAAWIKSDNSVVASPAIASTTASEFSPTAASAMGGVVVSWLSSAGPSLLAARNTSGGWSPSGIIATGVTSTLPPRIAGDATGAFVVYASGGELKVARIGGNVPAPSSVATVAPLVPSAVAIASLEPKRALVVYKVGKRLFSRVVSVVAADNGTTCTSDSACDSGICADGRCCNARCAGQCEACDVPGQEGSCALVLGTPPASRAACSGVGVGTPCGQGCIGDRTACTYPAASAPCSKDECASGTETHASTCDGAGKCNDVPKSCSGFGCVGLLCGTSCATRADCLSAFYCKDNKCIPLEGLGKTCGSKDDCEAGSFCIEGVCCEADGCGAGKTCASATKPGRCLLANGQTCASAMECGSGFCADSVCCESSCTDQCAACDVGGSMGKCSPVVGKPHGTRTDCPTDSNVCASRRCDGVATTECAAFTVAGVVCKAQSCAAGLLSEDSKCDGAGACAAGKSSTCGAYACEADGKACRTTCAVDGDCATGNRCEAGSCVPVASKCSDDRTSAVSTKDGATTACAPYLCDPAIGRCLALCASDSDCVVGLECRSSGECAAPAAAPTDDSGGCAYAIRAHGSAAPMLLGLWVLLRRRRRDRRFRDANAPLSG